jgi:two-component system, NtrC family, sensor kinase
VESSVAMAQARQKHHVEAILANLGLILTDCDDGLQRIAAIVQHLRSFSRVDTDEVRTAVDINAAVQGALTVARSELRHVAEVILNLPPLPPVVCVEGEIMQVFLNILVNAAQAIASQHRGEMGRVAIRTGVETGRVWVEIEDDGPGIPREVQARIFEPFFTTKPAGQGTGLGLGISRDIIVNKHGGRLEVRSHPGAGACFRIELPVGDR